MSLLLLFHVVFECLLGPIKTLLNFTPLLLNCTLKIDFELQHEKFFFLSPTATDLKISFEQTILKIPKLVIYLLSFDGIVIQRFFAISGIHWKQVFTNLYYTKWKTTP